MNIQKSILPELAQKSIKEKLDWIDERFSSAIENFDNETERGLALLQSRRMLREQVWPYCSASPFHKRLLTFLINSIDRVKPKSVTIAELNLLRDKTALLSAKELTKQETLEVEGALLTIE